MLWHSVHIIKDRAQRLEPTSVKVLLGSGCNSCAGVRTAFSLMPETVESTVRKRTQKNKKKKKKKNEKKNKREEGEERIKANEHKELANNRRPNYHTHLHFPQINLY
eukprot:comp21895_c0_seq2/m.31385 comp21895_c0_seq2/g.31385  ORF comp21895_c0_seq2/g.31385 comp21895_c0_seq2/m.31385 type:complete len:107 (+) comp21895_c0_seq2:481-801(+)